MFPSRFRLVAFLAFAISMTAYGTQDNPSWAPGLKPSPEVSTPLTPDAALKTFYMPPGYRIELVASEPLIQDPIVIDFDADGRLWAVEMPAFHYPDVRSAGQLDAICRIVVLEDANDDGKMDKRTVFMDGLVLPRALKVLPTAAYRRATKSLDSARHEWRSQGRYEGARDKHLRQTRTQIEHNANSLLWAMDNWMYTAGTRRLSPIEERQVRVAPTLPRGQWGVTQDDAGRIYRNTNSSALFVDFVPMRYFLRNPHLAAHPRYV